MRRVRISGGTSDDGASVAGYRWSVLFGKFGQSLRAPERGASEQVSAIRKAANSWRKSAPKLLK
jgi:hypothetical protein